MVLADQLGERRRRIDRLPVKRGDDVTSGQARLLRRAVADHAVERRSASGAAVDQDTEESGGAEMDRRGGATGLDLPGDADGLIDGNGEPLTARRSGTRTRPTRPCRRRSPGRER